MLRRSLFHRDRQARIVMPLDHSVAMPENLLHQRYQIIHPLGEGGFAKTYLAADWQQQKTRCVIKHLTPAHTSPHFLATARRLFEAEAAVLKRLGTHDRIPQLIDAFEVNGEFYLVQEFIDGESLHDILKRQLTYNEAQIIQLLEEVLPILVFIHREHVIHRDIKPSNLMRRRADGKFMLIDFGAVKEITTDFQTDASEQFTVSIGTQGYSAPEQMAGRPRYSSDLYSLGMTVIRGLTGRSPTELPENSQTGELLWETAAPFVSPGLKVFLKRLIHVSVYQRYPSAAAALNDLKHLDTLASRPTLDLPETVLSDELELAKKKRQQRLKGAIAPVLVTAIVLVIRQLGGWVPFELWAYDQWVQRLSQDHTDERMLLVEITEADLKELNQPTPSDAILSRAIETLQVYEPRVIGLDLYRDIPQGEGHEALLETLKAENVVAIRKIGNRPSEAIPPPSTVTADRVGFNDFPIDRDGVVRRNLLFAASNDSPEGEVFYSFGLQLALAYLAVEEILPLASEQNPELLELNGNTLFLIHPNFGGYRGVDAAGYQVMLQYRSASNAVPRLSLGDLLDGQFTEEMIRDRLVIIGTTAPSAKDLFYTPFSPTADADFLMPGVMLHVHATSQILDIALNEKTLLWAFPEGWELVWIALAGISGGLLGWIIRRPWVFGICIVGGIAVVISVSTGFFLIQGWLPLIPATAALTSSAIAAALAQSYLSSRQSRLAAYPTDVAPLPPLTK